MLIAINVMTTSTAGANAGAHCMHCLFFSVFPARSTVVQLHVCLDNMVMVMGMGLIICLLYFLGKLRRGLVTWCDKFRLCSRQRKLIKGNFQRYC